MSVPFLDLARQYEQIKTDVTSAVADVMESQRFILGPEVERLEAELAGICSTRRAVGVASGSDALLLTLQALGIGPGSEVVTTAFSFFATGSCVARLGARPVFADIDPLSYNLDPDAAGEATGPATRALLPVHLFGQCAATERLAEAASTAAGGSLPLVEDAAQAIGAGRHGRPAGSMGIAGCLSFYPTKNLGGAGDGGMVVTGDEALADRIKLLRVHGDAGRYDHREMGINSRLDALQAAVLRVKTKHLAAWNEARRRKAAGYGELLSDLEGTIVLPAELPGNVHVYHQYVIRSPRRDDLARHLTAAGIGNAIYYPVPLHLQPCFSHLGYRRGDLPRTESACEEVLALPIYPELTDSEQEQVAAAVTGFFEGR